MQPVGGWALGKRWTRDRFKSNGTDAFRDTHPLQPPSLCPLLYRKIGMMMKFMAFKSSMHISDINQFRVTKDALHEMCYVPKEFEK